MTPTIQDHYYLNSTVKMMRGLNKFNPRLNSLIYMKINFSKNGFENSLSETELELDQ